jgi:dTDP-4-dehydrorhamnose reductase
VTSHRRILITGGSGLLALNWACCMRDELEVWLAPHRRTVSLRGTRVVPLDLDSADRLSRGLEGCRPDLVVHTAGLTSVDDCEREPDQARHANAVLARNVAVAAARVDAQLIHISTDHLFAGTRRFYTEDDVPEPLNVYAQTKLLAEQWVAEAHPRALIVRTNFFGWGHRFRRSFSDWILDSLAKGEQFTMFDDVYVTPILADRLAVAAYRLLETGAAGVYNVAGAERLSKYAFALQLAQAFELPTAALRRGRIRDARLLAPRPHDMSLNSARARSRLNAPLDNAAEFILELRQQERDGRSRELLAAVTE